MPGDVKTAVMEVGAAGHFWPRFVFVVSMFSEDGAEALQYTLIFQVTDIQ